MEKAQGQSSTFWRVLLKLIFFLLCVGVISAIAGFMLLKINEKELQKVKVADQAFVVTAGSSLNQVIQQLEQNELIDCAQCLQVHTRVFGVPGSVKAGTYQLTGELSSLQILNLLIVGKIAEFSVTLVEGKTLDEWLEVLWSHPQVKKTIQGKTREERYAFIAKTLELEHQHPEGLFLPETYAFSADTADLSILKRALELQRGYLQEQWDLRQQPSPIKTAYEALILASIVEKETGTASERPVISGVFINRLRRKMRLETDPTVIYGIKDYDGNITRAHLREKTAYNTYQIHGLPPTPIAASSRAAIAAALQPQETTAIFFVAKGDGSHVFSETLQQHNTAVKAYQMRRRADYRSSPSQ